MKNCMMGSLWASQLRQSTTVMMVAGTLVTHKIQSLSDTCQLPSSAKLKKVVLNIAYCEVSRTTSNRGSRVLVHTEMKVGGRKIMPRSAIDFMTLLSWRARLLKACHM